MSSRPVIGITAAFETARWAVWDDVDVNISQRTYTDRVDEAGGIPVPLPTSEAGTADPGALVERIDALLLSGGADLDPATYGAEPNPMTTNFKDARDRFEIALCREAIDGGLPVLGVCRGFQVLNVALGGDLDQHLDDAEIHLHTPGTFSDHESSSSPARWPPRWPGRSASRSAPITIRASESWATACGPLPTVEQPGAQPVLDPGDRAADGRAGKAELVRRGAKAAQLRQAGEGLQLRQIDIDALHAAINATNSLHAPVPSYDLPAVNPSRSERTSS